MTSRRARAIAWGALAAVLAGYGALLFTSDAGPVRDFAHLDFYDYYLGAAAVAEGRSPYDGEWADAVARREGLPFVQGSHYIYPPWFAVVLRPVAELAPRSAAGLWFFLSVVALLAIARGDPRGAWPLVFFPPVLFSLFVGQINLLLLGAILGGFALRDRRPGWAGILLALAAATKVTPILLIAVMAAHRRWRLVGAAAATVLALWIIGWVGAPGAMTTWITEVLPSTGALAAHHGHPANQSLYGLAIRLLAPNTWTTPWLNAPSLVPWVARGGAALLLSLCAARIWSRAASGRASEATDAALVVSAMVVVGPLAWESTFALMLAPFLWLWPDPRRRRVVVGAWLLIAAQRGLDDFANHPQSYPLLVAVPPASALALLGAVIVLVSCVISPGSRGPGQVAAPESLPRDPGWIRGQIVSSMVASALATLTRFRPPALLR